MSITKQFDKLRFITDKLVVTGCPISSLDFTNLISKLGQRHYLVMVYIEAYVLKMSVNEVYSMLLTDEARLESNQSNASK